MRKFSLIVLPLLILFSCKSPEARRPVTHKSGSYIEEAIARNKKIVAEEEKQILSLIEEDTSNTYHSSPNGFWYFYNKKDTTTKKTPGFGDIVKFDYDLRTLNGQVIYSDEELPTRTYTIDKEKLFSGMRQGLKLMKEGETVTFLFPSHKAYGYYGDEKKIGSNVPVISTVTLHKIIEENNNQKINNQ